MAPDDILTRGLMFEDTPVFPAMAHIDRPHVVKLPLYTFDPDLRLSHAVGTILHHLSQRIRENADRDFMNNLIPVVEINIKPKDWTRSLNIRRKGNNIWVKLLKASIDRHWILYETIMKLSIVPSPYNSNAADLSTDAHRDNVSTPNTTGEWQLDWAVHDVFHASRALRRVDDGIFYALNPPIQGLAVQTPCINIQTPDGRAQKRFIETYPYGRSYYSVFRREADGIAPIPSLRKPVVQEQVKLREMENNFAHRLVDPVWWDEERMDVYVIVQRY